MHRCALTQQGNASQTFQMKETSSSSLGCALQASNCCLLTCFTKKVCSRSPEALPHHIKSLCHSRPFHPHLFPCSPR